MFNFIKNMIQNKLVNFGQVQYPKTFKEIELSADTFPFLLNDPSTKDFIVAMPILKKGNHLPNLSVKGLNKINQKIFTQDWRAQQVNNVLITQLNFFLKHTNKKINWPGTNELKILPFAGNQLNAYYDRKTLSFFAGKNRKGETIYTADSVDIVSHEMGHALLDAIRPDLWSVQSLEVWSFHEAWADIMSLFTIMQFDEVLEFILKETNNKLNKSCMVSKIGEHLGKVIYEFQGSKSGYDPLALRDAYNSFKYIPLKSLPKSGRYNEIVAEPHSFGRVFLGAFWELFVECFQLEAQKKEAMEALKYTIDKMAKVVIISAQKAPVSNKFYHSIAMTMLVVEGSLGGQWNQLIKQVFQKRNIFPSHQMKMLNKHHISEFKESQMVSKIDDSIVVKKNNDGVFNFSKNSVFALSENQLMKCDIEIPTDSVYHFNEKGFLDNYIIYNKKDIYSDAKNCLDYLNNNHLVGDDKWFLIEDGKLVRNMLVNRLS